MIALVLGGSESLWDDIGRFNELGVEVDVVVAVNDAAAQYPDHVDYLVTLHPERVRLWRRERESRGLVADWKVVGQPEHAQFVDLTAHRFEGSSGLLAVDAAFTYVEDAYPVLCGIPMGPQRHIHGSYANSARAIWTEWKRYRPEWVRWARQCPEQAARVRSMSGWTRDEFGAPTAEWLRGAA